MQNRDVKYILWIVIATGVASVAAQLVIIREFLTLFSGNEFIIAITLFNWLVLGGIGTIFARFLQRLVKPSPIRLSLFSFLLCFFGLFEIFAIRILHKIAFIHGQEAGFYQTFAFTFLTSAPYCILVGFLLPFSLYVIKNISKDFSSVKVYMADNSGDALGGALFSFALVFIFTPVKAVICSFLPLMIISFFAMSHWQQSKGRAVMIITVMIMLTVLGILFENRTLERKNCDLKFYRETPYGRVEVQEYMDDFSLFRDGVPLFDTKNSQRAEQLVHYGLSQIDNVQNILFVSASSNVFTQAQKYLPRRIDYIEIDPKVAQALFDFSFLQNSGNINVIHDDARKYLNSGKTKYSAVIMDLPDPDTFGLNRYYTKEFFMTVKEHLMEDGVFVFSIQGFENYPEDNLLKKISSIYATGRFCFDHLLMLPFSQTYFIMSQRPLDQKIPELLKKRGIKTSYIEKYFISDLVNLKIEKLNKQINMQAPLNSDFSPVIIKHAFGHWFSKFNSSPLIFAVTASVIFFCYVFFLSKPETILFFTGFAAMATQIANIFVFQILFGYIYLKTGMLITLFLAGLLQGAWMGEKFSRRPSLRHLAGLDMVIIALMLIFTVSVHTFGSNLPQACFLCFSFVFAIFCGLQFSLGIKTGQGSSNLVAGLFAADLMGAAAGLLIFTLVLLPFSGIFNGVMALCVIKTLSWIRCIK